MRMCIKITYQFIGLILFVLSGCSGYNVDKNLVAAETAMANSDYTMAQKICNSIADRDSLNDLSATQLCKLSIILMELSEHNDEETNVGMATNCYHKALELHADSALRFYRSLPPERESLVHMLWVLDRSESSDGLILDIPADSAVIDSFGMSDNNDRYLDSLKNKLKNRKDER